MSYVDIVFVTPEVHMLHIQPFWARMERVSHKPCLSNKADDTSFSRFYLFKVNMRQFFHKIASCFDSHSQNILDVRKKQDYKSLAPLVFIIQYRITHPLTYYSPTTTTTTTTTTYYLLYIKCLSYLYFLQAHNKSIITLYCSLYYISATHLKTVQVYAYFSTSYQGLPPATIRWLALFF